jgi:hypothetical protein
MPFRTAAGACALALAIATLTGCTSSSSPARPTSTQGTTLDAFAGVWSSRGAAAAGALPNGCTQLDYDVTPATDGRSAAVRFNGACAGITANGSGRGTLSGETLNWTAEGTTSYAGLTCPFSFTNSSATRVGNDLRVDYSGSVCGVAVKGSELLKRP